MRVSKTIFMEKYNHDKIERKWQKYWKDKKIWNRLTLTFSLVVVSF